MVQVKEGRCLDETSDGSGDRKEQVDLRHVSKCGLGIPGWSLRSFQGICEVKTGFTIILKYDLPFPS